MKPRFPTSRLRLSLAQQITSCAQMQMATHWPRSEFSMLPTAWQIQVALSTAAASCLAGIQQKRKSESTTFTTAYSQYLKWQRKNICRRLEQPNAWLVESSRQDG